MDSLEPTAKADDRRVIAPSQAAPESVDDKINRLVYAGAKSIADETTSRIEKTIQNPSELLVNGGLNYVAGTLLGALGSLPGKFKCLGAAAGIGLAAFSMKDELSPERLSKISGTAQSIWDSKENMDAKVHSMQKNFAPVIMDTGSLVLGFLTGKGLKKQKQIENESKFEFEWRMDGLETKRQKLSEWIELLATGRICKITTTKHKGSQFCWPWSGNAEEFKLYKKLKDAKTLYGEDSLATAEQRGWLSQYYRRHGMIKEADYQLEKSKVITDKAMSDLDAGQVDAKMALLPDSYHAQIKKADQYFRKADKYSEDAHTAFLAKNMDKATKLYEKAALHYTVGLKAHPGHGKCVADARSNFDDTLARVGRYHEDRGDLTSAYLAFKRMVTKQDGTIDYSHCLSLAKVCERMKFHDEAEQLYRGFYAQKALVLDGKDYWYESKQRDALQGITRCLVKRGKISEAKELGMQLKELGCLNDSKGRSWATVRKADKVQHNVEAMHRVLDATKFNEHSEFLELPATWL